MENINKILMLGFCTMLFSVAVWLTTSMYMSISRLAEVVEEKTLMSRVLEGE